MRETFWLGVVGLVLASAAGAADLGRGDWRLQRQAIEEFLAAAEVTDQEDIPIGVTLPKRVTLSRGSDMARASWKTYDLVADRITFDDGRREINFRDSYKHEIAAYHLDQMLGLDLVPPTVHRKIDKEDGAMRIWVEDSMTEAERRAETIAPPDEEAWNRQIQGIRLFYSLIYNADYKNVNNLVIDQEFKLSAIDLSRGFGVKKDLVWGQRLTRVWRPVLENMKALTRDSLSERLGDWINQQQIKSLLKRRDALVDRIDAMIELKGEDAVIFD